MSNESSILKNLTESVADVPQSSGLEENYVPLLVLLCVFAGTLLALLFVLLIFCRRCLRGGRRYSRASNDPEKTNTTYLEESQHVPEITIQVDESDHLSASSDHDADTDRFLSAVSTGRRVSFNESALLDHGKRAQERGRRYTLTEGDFHHLKNARLTHLHLPPPALRILTIHECDTSGNGIQQSPRPAPKPSLSIFQPPVCLLPQTALTGLSPSSALPGDTLNSVVDTSATDSPPTPPAGPPRSCTIEVMGHRTWNGGASGVDDEETSEAGVTRAQGQGSVLQFFTKLRRHASLEGPSPYFKIKKWKFDSSQRASSLDTRGSPKRHQFQRQRAASESMQQDAEEVQQMELVPSVPSTQQDEAYRPSFPSPPPTPPPSLHRLEMEEVVMEPSCAGAMGVSDPLLSHEPQDEVEQGAEPGPAVSFRQDSTEQQTLYRDIWTLRASLEQYASSDQSSNNDRDSVRSDADSVCSLGGPASRPGGLSSCPSQDTGDDPDEGVSGARGEDGASSVEPERGGGDGGGSGSGSDGDSGNRKLLQMDSGYASIEAPSRAPEDLRLFGAGGGSGGGARGKTASEKRHFFTSAGRKGSVCESVEARLFQEELEDQAAAEAELGLGESSVVSPWPPYGQVIPAKEVTKPRPQLFRRRDYSIDEKTDALFNEFLRHDPRFDQQGSPARPRHRSSRVHLRKQWQRAKQNSDPGVAVGPSRGPLLRRGDSANFPLDTRYHGTLPRIVSAADEEASEAAEAQRMEAGEGGASTPDKQGVELTEGGAGTPDKQGVELTEGGGSTPDKQGVKLTEGGASTAETQGAEMTEGGASTSDKQGAVTDDSDCPANMPRVESYEGGAISESTPLPEGSRADPEEDKSKVSPSSSSSASSGSNRTIKEGEPSSPPPSERQDPETGYGPQTVSAELADKLARGLEDRLYTGLRRVREGVERTVKFTHTSPDHSPV